MFLKEWMENFFSFSTLHNGCLVGGGGVVVVVVRGNAAQRHRDGHHPSKMATFLFFWLLICSLQFVFSHYTTLLHTSLSA